jgi:hypothetical protein
LVRSKGFLPQPSLGYRQIVFHALQGAAETVTVLENRAYQAVDARSTLERKQAKANKSSR